MPTGGKAILANRCRTLGSLTRVEFLGMTSPFFLPRDGLLPLFTHPGPVTLRLVRGSGRLPVVSCHSDRGPAMLRTVENHRPSRVWGDPCRQCRASVRR